MVTRSSHHVHTRYVDGKNTAQEMAKAAFDAGFASLGFSEHAPQCFDRAYGLAPDDLQKYVSDVCSLKQAYADRMTIHLGLELDEYGDTGLAPCEYIIGSKHYMLENGIPRAVDGDFEEISAFAHRNGGWISVCARYFRELAAYIERANPVIVGHFDLPTKWNEGGRCFDESDPDYLSAGFEALERIVQTGALLEVNTGAIARGYRTAPYPSLPFLKRWKALGGGVILGSDCHNARNIAEAYDLAEEYIQAAGFKNALRLGVHTLFEEYSLK